MGGVASGAASASMAAGTGDSAGWHSSAGSGDLGGRGGLDGREGSVGTSAVAAAIGVASVSSDSSRLVTLASAVGVGTSDMVTPGGQLADIALGGAREGPQG